MRSHEQRSFDRPQPCRKEQELDLDDMQVGFTQDKLRQWGMEHVQPGISILQPGHLAKVHVHKSKDNPQPWAELHDP